MTDYYTKVTFEKQVRMRQDETYANCFCVCYIFKGKYNKIKAYSNDTF